jgi:hypothetical protein
MSIGGFDGQSFGAYGGQEILIGGNERTRSQIPGKKIVIRRDRHRKLNRITTAPPT